MGLLRLILAISVLISHLPDIGAPTFLTRDALPIKIWSGHAVFAFFIISGFYISLIYNEKYSKLASGKYRFYINRALRLYPAHWLILILFSLLFIATGAESFIVGDYRNNAALGVISQISNILLFGTELIAFFEKSNWYYILGPVWSLSIESYFYILAPFFVFRNIKFLLFMAASFLLLRLSMYWAGAELLPWRYFYFPSVFIFFILGSISYKLYVIVKNNIYVNQIGMILLALFLYINSQERFWVSSDLDMLGSWVFFLYIFIAIPFIFQATKNSKIDNFIGQLTYPIYIGHMFIIHLVSRSHTQTDKGLLAFTGSIVLAVFIYYLIDKPINNKLRTNISQ